MKDFKTIEEWLDYHYNTKNIKNFYTTSIQKSVTNVTLEDVYKICEQYKKNKKLNILFELICPKCNSTVDIYKSITDIAYKTKCIKCGYKDIEEINDSIVLYEFIRNE